MRICHASRILGLGMVALAFPSVVQGQTGDGKSRFPNMAEQAVAEQWITDSALRADIKFLADDLLEGRGPGTRGDDLAQRYIVSQFEQIGLEPAAPNGGWIQKVPLVGVTTKPPKEVTFQIGKANLTLQDYRDYILTSGLPNERSGFQNAEVVFAGYGMQAPEYDWDDFKDLDVKGKVLIVMNNDPADRPEIFGGRTRLYYGRWDYKYAKAAELGAAGVFIIHTTPSAGYPYQVVQTSWTGEQMALGGEVQGRLPMEGWLTEEAARKVVAMAGKNLDQLRAAAEQKDFRPVPLDGMTVSVDLKCQVRQRETGNVLGLLPGTDPELSKEWIIFMAHHDHIGMTPARDKTTDNIYNGAVDNASGTAVLMAIARAVMSLPESSRPQRSILFAAVGAEEQGLLGSEFMARNPPVPAGYLAAVLNIDGVNILGRTEDVVVIGKGKSDMDPIIERLARWQKRVVVPDQFPDRGYYYRSDQFSLAKVGVPGVYLGAGVHVIGKPEGWGRQKLREWTENIYHQTSDEYSPDWDLSGAVQDARLMFFAGLQVANQANFPAWKKGDEFEAARLKAIGQRDVK